MQAPPKICAVVGIPNKVSVFITMAFPLMIFSISCASSCAFGLKAVGAGPDSNFVFILPNQPRLKLKVESILSMYSMICVFLLQSSTKKILKLFIGCITKSFTILKNRTAMLLPFTIGAISKRQKPAPSEYFTGSKCLLSSIFMMEPIAIPSENETSFS